MPLPPFQFHRILPAPMMGERSTSSIQRLRIERAGAIKLVGNPNKSITALPSTADSQASATLCPGIRQYFGMSRAEWRGGERRVSQDP